VKCRKKINWFENRPLFGKRVVVTRTRTQASGMSKQLRDLGADVLEIPTIRIAKPEGDELIEFGKLVQDCHKYEWLIFTSPNGVDAFFDLFYKLYDDARSIGGARIAAVGPGTKAKLAEYRVATDLMPEKHVAEELAKEIKKQIGDLNSLQMLWVRGEDARPVLSEMLVKEGAILDEAIAYVTVPETDDPTGNVKRFREEGADIVTFTSGSTVECFLDLGLDIPEITKIASIGPVTTEAIEENQLIVDIEAEDSTIPGLVKAVLKLAGK
ncbi:uroporphyrinogen-III synthase, partial [bacterium]|nr:uroporphyrinogen-III synthase [bacterium]